METTVGAMDALHGMYSDSERGLGQRGDPHRHRFTLGTQVQWFLFFRGRSVGVDLVTLIYFVPLGFCVPGTVNVKARVTSTLP
jgi:hypothetical protein